CGARALRVSRPATPRPPAQDRRFLRVIDAEGLGSFFFQAEDGIRDSSVTGVQTCALPIYIAPFDPGAQRGDVVAGPPHPRLGARSEERRVGKERQRGGARGGGNEQRRPTVDGASDARR